MPTDHPAPTAAALERRIKRHLIGRVQSFYAVTAPGLETLCRRELEALGGEIKIGKTEKGGIAFEGRLHEIYAANLHCRTAHRFLMRIGGFRAETFETLVQKTAEIPWELYLRSGCPTAIKVSAYRSRLYHSDAVAERIRQGIHARMAAEAPPPVQQPDSTPEQAIHARLTHDRCQLSIDSSGANLHKRGFKVQGGGAPLRETLAAAVLMRAGFTGREVLCDPMCGSGTFAIEAALMAKKIPPGWRRSFAFQDWPAFRDGRWRHIRRTATPPETAWPRPLIYASDREAEAARALQQVLAAHGLDDVVQAAARGFEDLDGPGLNPTGGIVVLNPPYGRRMGSRHAAELTYLRIGRHLKTAFKGWTAAVLAPNRRLADLLGLKVRHYNVPHGGQRVHLLVGKIPA
jgi:putative N6-adenine-specific DNA methylase